MFSRPDSHSTEGLEAIFVEDPPHFVSADELSPVRHPYLDEDKLDLDVEASRIDLAYFLHALAYAHFERRQYEWSILLFEQLCQLFKPDSPSDYEQTVMAMSYEWIADVYRELGDEDAENGALENALKHQWHSISLQRAADDMGPITLAAEVSALARVSDRLAVIAEKLRAAQKFRGLKQETPQKNPKQPRMSGTPCRF